MADKSVSELIAATSVTPTDLFVLEQNGTAKKLTGQILENWLVSFADGHGGIQSIVKEITSGLVDTYRITLADTTTFDFMVTNGKSIESISKASTSGLVDTYLITFNDSTSGTFTVTNGAKGDKGDRADIWVKYASQKPTASSHSFGDVPDTWIGIATGHNMDAAPTDWQQYTWFQWKGEKGDTGEPATLVSSQVTYQVGDSGTIIPSGSWQTSVPSVTPGKFLWTRQVLQFNTGAPINSYSVSRFGIDGSGAVSTVAGVAPDANGNVPLNASSVKALALTGGTMEGAINMNGQNLGGLNEPKKDDEAASKGYVDKTRTIEQGGTGAQSKTDARKNMEVAQAIESEEYPGCFYRMVNDQTEWINPPLIDGTEYLTTERYAGYPVYVKYLNFGQLPGNETKTLRFSSDSNAMGIRVTGKGTGGGTHITIPVHASASESCSLYLSGRSVAVSTIGTSWVVYTVGVVVHYVKLKG